MGFEIKENLDSERGSRFTRASHLTYQSSSFLGVRGAVWESDEAFCIAASTQNDSVYAMVSWSPGLYFQSLFVFIMQKH